MVCVPCFIVPVLLFLWHKFIQPIVLSYWNLWGKKDAQGNAIKEGPQFPLDCKGGSCAFLSKSKQGTIKEAEPKVEVEANCSQKKED